MNKKMKYKKYAPWIKAAISMTGKTDLFPELEIPISTSTYWIERRYTTEDPIVETLTNAINSTRDELRATKLALVEKESIRLLVKDIFTIFGFNLRWKHIESKELKCKILDAIENSMTNALRPTSSSA